MHKLYFSSSLLLFILQPFISARPSRRPSVELQEITLRLEIHLNEAPESVGDVVDCWAGEIKCNDYLFSDNLHEKLSFPRDVFHDLTFFSPSSAFYTTSCARCSLPLPFIQRGSKQREVLTGEVWERKQIER